ncbi:OpgC domain-containing protein [Paracoccus sp. (in: a-proteobacteria)]|uniref:OpgC domain-containing protein n=1 Tax=Paracoccus sp. TaxID=267 RepID=UPI0026E0FFF7|nr:OpgC domain-containing protein [Paracoccus sp. (in: a-proteobacteria)]MDO5370485.1 OpgC domain-containing protein [Paracoccus sp. (in: a-proteobacteria)]
MSRIVSLDMLRGYALVCIMLNHMPVGVLRQLTLSNFAVYDAAELFVLLSGFLVGLVWMKVERAQGRLAAQWRFARRAGQVWLALVLGGILLALLSRGLLELGFRHTAIWNEYARWIIEVPVGYVATLALMWLQPNLLDVLALYVIVLALAPVLVPLMLRWPVAFFAGSVAVWLMAVPLNAALPNHRVEGGLLFNPFGWQLLFHTGVAMGAFRHRFMPVLRRHARWLTPISVAITLYSLAMVTLWRFGPEGKRLADILWHAVGSVDKWSLDWVRYVSIMAASWLVAVPLSGLFAWAAGTAPGRALGTIGKGGLVAFVACVLLSVLGDAMALSLPKGAARLGVDLWTIAALWLTAHLWLREKARRMERRSKAE